MSARRPNSTMRRCWRRSLRQAAPRVHCSRRRPDGAGSMRPSRCSKTTAAALPALACIAQCRSRSRRWRRWRPSVERRPPAVWLGPSPAIGYRGRQWRPPCRSPRNLARSCRPTPCSGCCVTRTCGPRRCLSARAPWTRCQETLIDLLGDLDRGVCVEAACALGRMGWPEALPALRLALRHAPSARVIESAPPVADDECVVLLGRIASGPDAGLAAAAAAALEVVEHPLATRLLARLRNE